MGGDGRSLSRKAHSSDYNAKGYLSGPSKQESESRSFTHSEIGDIIWWIENRCEKTVELEKIIETASNILSGVKRTELNNVIEAKKSRRDQLKQQLESVEVSITDTETTLSNLPNSNSSDA